MNIFQGKPSESFIEKLDILPEINQIFNSEKTPKETKTVLNENLNFLKIEEHLIRKQYNSFMLKIAASDYYKFSLGDLKRKKKKYFKGTFS